MGVELTGKTLGVVGAGNIGSIVIARALGLKMKVVAYDPFLTEERADDLGVRKVELDELLGAADFITMHVPLTDKTKTILGVLQARPLTSSRASLRPSRHCSGWTTWS